MTKFPAQDAQAVADSFNPYQEWLGLGADVGVPNHYQLLGLPQFESDSQTIAAAADRTMSQVRGCKPGEHAGLWARLLDEIATAKACLTDAGQRGRYDAQLKSGSLPAAAPQSVDSGLPPNPATPVATPTPAAGLPDPMAPVGGATQQPLPAATPLPAQAAPVPGVPVLQPNTGLQAAPAAPIMPQPGGVPGMPVPTQPIQAQPLPAQPMPQAQPLPVQPVPQVQPGVPTVAPVQPAMPTPVGPAPIATPQAAPVQPAPVVGPAATPMIAPAGAQPQLPGTAPAGLVQPAAPADAGVGVAENKPQLKKRSSATAMASKRASAGAYGPILIGAGIGLVVLMGAGVVVFLQRTNNQNQVVQRPQPQPKQEVPRGEGMKRVTDPGAPFQPTPRATPEVNPAPIAIAPTEPVMENPDQPAMDTDMADSGPAPLTAEELAEFDRAIQAARTALQARQLAAAAEEVAKAEPLARFPEQREPFGPVKLFVDSVIAYDEAIDESLGRLEGGSSFPVGTSTSVELVSINNDRLVVRVADQTMRLQRDQLPLGIATGLAELTLSSNNEETPLRRGAFWAMQQNTDAEDMARVKGWLEEAGADDLIALLPEASPAAAQPSEPTTTPTPSGDVATLGRALDSARKALLAQNFDALDRNLERAEAAAASDEHKQLVARLQGFAELVREFRSVIDEGLSELSAAEVIDVKGVKANVIEASADRLVVRVSGKRYEFTPDRMPPGLGVAIAHTKLVPDAPGTVLRKAAYVLANSMSKDSDRERARQWWGEATSDDAEQAELVQALEDSYDLGS